MKKQLMMVAGLLGTAWTAQAELTLEGVLEDYLEARGGLEQISNTQSMKATGKMIMGAIEAPFAFTYKAPDKVYTTFEVQGMKGIQAYDGETGWQVMPFMGKDGAVLMSEDELKQVKDQGEIEGPLVFAEKKGTVLELIGKTEVEGTPVIEIKATKKNGDVIHVFLDEEYKLEVMTRAKMKMMGQEVEAETYFSDYKEVGENNMPVAHSMAVKINGMAAQNMNFEQVEFDVPVTDDLFKMPAVAETKEAAETTE